MINSKLKPQAFFINLNSSEFRKQTFALLKSQGKIPETDEEDDFIIKQASHETRVSLNLPRIGTDSESFSLSWDKLGLESFKNRSTLLRRDEP